MSDVQQKHAEYMRAMKLAKAHPADALAQARAATLLAERKEIRIAGILSAELARAPELSAEQRGILARLILPESVTSAGTVACAKTASPAVGRRSYGMAQS